MKAGPECSSNASQSLPHCKEIPKQESKFQQISALDIISVLILGIVCFLSFYWPTHYLIAQLGKEPQSSIKSSAEISLWLDFRRGVFKATITLWLLETQLSLWDNRKVLPDSDHSPQHSIVKNPGPLDFSGWFWILDKVALVMNPEHRF
jgi:hypothetical protein